MTNSTHETHLLEDFLSEVGRGKTHETRIRYRRILGRLQYFLDGLDVAPLVGTEVAALLEIERDFGRLGAFFRVVGPDQLARCLPEFVGPDWLPASRLEARMQISLVGCLVRWLERRSSEHRAA